MATRMQQRRGTAAQWISVNNGDGPTLAAGEIGFETDTGKFKIGDGVNPWVDLVYYASADDLAAVIDGAPALLDTLNELAAAIGDDADFVNTMASKTFVGTAIDNHSSVSTAVHGIADTSLLVNQSQLSEAVTDHSELTTNIHGIANTLELATKAEVTDAENYADNAVADHNSATEGIHGIINTAELATNSSVASNIATHNDVTTNVHGIEDTSVLATQTDVNNKIDTHNLDTTSVHGIVDTSLLATQTDIANTENYADDAVSTHNLDTTSVHGIDDTSALATKTYADNAVSTHSSDTTSVHGIADTSALATKTYADDAVSTHSSDTTSVHGITDTSKLVTTDGAQTLTNKTITSPSGLVKADVGLGNVDNTSDANKPVSTATQTALDLKANLAGPTFTGTVNAADLILSGNLTVSGTTTTVDTQDLVVSDPMIYVGEGNSANLVDLGFVSSFNDGTYQHSGLVRDSSDGKWKLFKGVTDEPTTTVNFSQGSLDDLAVGGLTASSLTVGSVSNTELGYLDGVTSAIQTQIDAKAPKADPTFTGTVNAAAITASGLVTASSSGVAFSDGTQTKEGVPSRTPIVQKTASYTLSALNERDSLVEISSASGVTLTVPPNSSVAFPVGTSIDILQTSTGQITVAAGAGVTLNGTPGLKLRTQWSGATLFKRATDTWVLYGDLTA